MTGWTTLHPSIEIAEQCQLKMLYGKVFIMKNGKRQPYRDEVLKIGDIILLDKFSSVEIIENGKVINKIESGTDKIYFKIKKR